MSEQVKERVGEGAQQIQEKASEAKHETRERLRLRMKEQRAGADVWKRIHAVTKRVEMNGYQRMRVRASRDHATQM